MKRLPEGVRRICTVLGVLMVAWWLVTIGYVSNGFTQVKSFGWPILIAGIFVSYKIPIVVYRIYRWVKDGFAMDVKH